jgi:uncharacterized alpha-E superfamily protein
MLSRVAESLYWFARYVRRAENMARLVGVGSQLQLDLPRSVKFMWQPMIETVGVATLFKTRFPDASVVPTDVDVMRFLLLDEVNPSSLRHSIDTAREMLRGVRDTLPPQLWEVLTDLHMFVADDGEKMITRRHRVDFIAHIVDGCLKISGLVTATVSRDIGFQFMQFGTAIEQADMTTRIIDAGASGLVAPRKEEDRETFRNLQWMAVLSSLAADQTYRRHVRQRVTGEHALRFLLQHYDFPRSVHFCLSRAQRMLAAMPPRPEVEKRLGKLVDAIQTADPAALVAKNPASFMDEIQVQLSALHGAVAGGYFSVVEQVANAQQQSPAAA